LATYYRVLLPLLLPDDVDRALYLDSDMVCVGSIASLFELDVDDCPGAAARVYTAEDVARNPENFEDGADYSNGYFQVGALLMNLKWWRDNDAVRNVFSVADRSKCMDQGAINLLYSKEIKASISLRYNFSHFMPCGKYTCDEGLAADIEDARSNPVIIHYAGSWTSIKPWYKGCDEGPYRDIWRHVKSLSPWKDDPLKWPYRRRIAEVTLTKLFGRRIFQKLGVIGDKEFAPPPKGLLERLKSRMAD
jgi:lipopolysaccharide biosynthesis glycosyltransferase